EIAEFLGQTVDDHVYWVERSGKAQRTLSLNAAPVDVAAFLRRRLFGSDTSIIMTSATLSTTSGATPATSTPDSAQPASRIAQRRRPTVDLSGLNYFIRRV